MADTNRSRLSVVGEIQQGIVPTVTFAGLGGSNLLRVRKTSEGINFPKSTKVSDEIREDRNITNLIDMGGQVGGNIAFEMYAPGQSSDQNLFLQTAYCSQFLDMRFIANVDGGGAGGQFAATTITLAAGFLNVMPIVGDIISLRNTGNGNDGAYQVTTVAGQVLTLAALPGFGASPLNVGPSSPGMTISFAGRFYASGPTISATGLITFPAAHSLPVVPGQWIKLANCTVPAMNTFVRVFSTTSTTIQVDSRPAGWIATTAQPNFYVFAGSYLRNGTQENSFSLEQAVLDISAPYYSISSGCLIDQASFSFDTGAAVTGSYTVMGIGHSAGIGTTLGSPAPALTTRAMSSRTNVARMTFNGGSLSGLASAKSMSFAIANNLRAKPGIGSSGLIGIGQGNFSITGQMTSYFSDGASYDLYLSGGTASIATAYGIDNQYVLQTIPRLQMTSNQHTAGGSNQDISAVIAFQGLIDPMTGCAAQVDYFDFAF